MTHEGAELDNSYVTIHNQEIDIHYRKKRFTVAVDKVTKMYLHKKKSKLAGWIPGIEQLLEKQYSLYIRTRDNRQICMEVKASERQYFIDSIAMVRKLNGDQNQIQAAS